MLFLTLIIAIATTTLNASHNFYVGTSVAASSLTAKRSDSAKNTSPVTATFTHNKRCHADGVYGGIFTGYLFKYKNFGIGPEFFYNYGKLENKISGTHYDAGGPFTTVYDVFYKFSNQKGVHVRIGYFLDSYFLYGLAGLQYQTGYFEVAARNTNAMADVTQETFRTKKKNSSTFSYGLGLQKLIEKNFAIGLECKFSSFPNRSYAFELNDLVRTTLDSSLKYQLRSISLKLMYVF